MAYTHVEPGFRIEAFFSYLIIFIIASIEVILGLQVILRLLGANPLSEFVNFIYSLSQPLLAPFFGVFPLMTIGGRFVLDITAIFAMIVYGIIGYLLHLLAAAIAVSGSSIE